MLVFADESGKYHPDDPNPYAVLAAVAVDPATNRNLSREIFNLKKKFWGISSPFEWEIKGRKLLSKRAFTSPKKREFVEEIFSLCRACEVTSFATIRDRPVQMAFDIMSETNLPLHYGRLLERVNGFMEEYHSDQMAMMIFDAVDEGTDRLRGTAFSNFLFRSDAGKACTFICDTAFFASSAITPGIQIADLFAYCINQKFQGRAELDPFYEAIKEMEFISKKTEEEYPLRGIRYVE